jgi:hypothetical protein
MMATRTILVHYTRKGCGAHQQGTSNDFVPRSVLRDLFDERKGCGAHQQGTSNDFVPRSVLRDLFQQAQRLREFS